MGMGRKEYRERGHCQSKYGSCQEYPEAWDA